MDLIPEYMKELLQLDKKTNDPIKKKVGEQKI